MHHNIIPWKDIVISGHVLSGSKDKISKSKENESTTPENLLSKYSADAIRFWTASGTLGQDISFSETQLNIGQKLTTKLWNAFRFGYEHLQNFTPQNECKNFGVVNEWLLHRSTECFKNYKNYFEQNEFGLALDVVEKFFWKDFCDNYLELIKDQLFNIDKYSKEEVEATKWTLYNVGLRILQLYAPYLPYVTENIYEIFYKNNLNINSLHQTKYAAVQKEYSFNSSIELMERIINLISEVRKLKTESQLSLKTEIEDLEIYGIGLNDLKSLEQLIKGVTQAKNIKYFEENIEKSQMNKEGEILRLEIKV